MPIPAIKGFQANTLIDWEGKIASVIFLPGCNMRCPFCHAVTLITHPEKLDTIPFSDIEKFLKARSGWIDGVVICGGEPTIQPELPEFIAKIKACGLLVKLDTNGTNSAMLKSLISTRLIDYIAMDVKAPLDEERYNRACGRFVAIDKIRASIQLIINSEIDYEFRTTVVPTILDKEDIVNIAQSLKGAKRYVLQQFVPHETLAPEMREVTPFSEAELKEMASAASAFVPTTYRNA